MKITIEIYDLKYSVEMPDNSNFQTFANEFENICKALYSEETINKHYENDNSKI